MGLADVVVDDVPAHDVGREAEWVVGGGVASQRVVGAEECLVEVAARQVRGALLEGGDFCVAPVAPDVEVGVGEGRCAEHVGDDGHEVVGVTAEGVEGERRLVGVAAGVGDDAAEVEVFGQTGGVETGGGGDEHAGGCRGDEGLPLAGAAGLEEEVDAEERRGAGAEEVDVGAGKSDGLQGCGVGQGDHGR